MYVHSSCIHLFCVLFVVVIVAACTFDRLLSLYKHLCCIDVMFRTLTPPIRRGKPSFGHANITNTARHEIKNKNQMPRPALRTAPTYDKKQKVVDDGNGNRTFLSILPAAPEAPPEGHLRLKSDTINCRVLISSLSNDRLENHAKFFHTKILHASRHSSPNELRHHPLSIMIIPPSPPRTCATHNLSAAPPSPQNKQTTPINAINARKG